MKPFYLALLSIFCIISTPKAKDAILELNDNIIFWSYSSPKQKMEVIQKFVHVDSAHGQFKIDDNFGSGIDSELVKLSACMDRRWYPAYLEFAGNLEIFHIAVACAYERHWFKDEYDDDYGVEIEEYK